MIQIFGRIVVVGILCFLLLQCKKGSIADQNPDAICQPISDIILYRNFGSVQLNYNTIKDLIILPVESVRLD